MCQYRLVHQVIDQQHGGAGNGSGGLECQQLRIAGASTDQGAAALPKGFGGAIVREQGLGPTGEDGWLVHGFTSLRMCCTCSAMAWGTGSRPCKTCSMYTAVAAASGVGSSGTCTNEPSCGA